MLIYPLGPTLTTETKAFLMFEMEKALETLNLLILVISKVIFLFLTSLNALSIYFTYCVPGTVLSILPGQTHSVLTATLWRRCSHDPYFTSEETGTKRLSDSAKVTHPVRSRPRVPFSGACVPDCGSENLCMFGVCWPWCCPETFMHDSRPLTPSRQIGGPSRSDVIVS